MEYNRTLEEVNAEVVQTMIPVMTYVTILMTIGIVGNPLVIIFYGIRLKPTTASYMFIVSLAVFDLVICCVSMPLEIVDMVQFYTFESTGACKILRFVNYFASITSGVFLIAIAVDRYRKVCRPFRAQITIEMARTVIIGAMFIGFFFSWPSFVFYTVQDLNITEAPGVVGRDCTTNREEEYRMYITVYNIVLFLVFLIAIVALIVLYTLVGKQLFSLRSFRFYVASKNAEGPHRPKSSKNKQKRVKIETSTLSSSSDVKDSSVSNEGYTSEERDEFTGEIRDGALSTIQEHDDDEDFGSVSRPGTAVQRRPGSSSSNSGNLSSRSNAKILGLLSTRIAPERFNLDREYTGITGITESSGRTYKTATTGSLSMYRENSAMTEMTGLTDSTVKTLPSSSKTVIGITRENSGMTKLTGISGSTGGTFRPPAYNSATTNGITGLVRENSNMTEMTGISESSGKTYTTTSTGVTGLYRENSGMTELTDLSSHSNAVKVVRPAKNVVKGPPKAGQPKTRIGSASTSVSIGSSVSGYSDSSKTSIRTRDARARGSIDGKKGKSQNIDTKMYTIIMMCITTAFIVSFLPYLSLVTWRTLEKEYEINLLNKGELVAFSIGLRSFLLNSAANPLIYGFLNSEFRQFALSILCGLCGCFRNDKAFKKHSRSSNELSKGSSKGSSK